MAAATGVASDPRDIGPNGGAPSDTAPTEPVMETTAPLVQIPSDSALPPTVPGARASLDVAGKLAPEAAASDTRGVGSIAEVAPEALPESALEPLPDALGPGKLAAPTPETADPVLPTVVEAALNTMPSDPPAEPELVAAPTQERAAQEGDDEPASNWVAPDGAPAPTAAPAAR